MKGVFSIRRISTRRISIRRISIQVSIRVRSRVRVRVRVRVKVRLRVRVRVFGELKFGELKFGELKRNRCEGLGHGECGARTYNGGSGDRDPSGVQGQSPRWESVGQNPPEAESFLAVGLPTK